jgi:polyisoprenoid-binding protein YceI
MTSTQVGTPQQIQDQLTSGALDGEWNLDGSRSTVTLKSKSMWGLAPVKGVFTDVSGQGAIAAGGAATGTMTIATASLSTKNAKRDKHLQSADFFDSANHPSITFQFDQVSPAPERLMLGGMLTVRGRTRPISFPADVTLVGTGEISIDATVQIDRAEFGLTWNQMGMASMKNDITVHIVLTKD